MTACWCTTTPQIGRGCICTANADSVRALTAVRKALTGTYTPEGIQVWLGSANKNLHGAVPSQLILDGQGKCVVEEARRVGAA